MEELSLSERQTLQEFNSGKELDRVMQKITLDMWLSERLNPEYLYAMHWLTRQFRYTISELYKDWEVTCLHDPWFESCSEVLDILRFEEQDVRLIWSQMNIDQVRPDYGYPGMKGSTGPGDIFWNLTSYDWKILRRGSLVEKKVVWEKYLGLEDPQEVKFYGSLLINILRPLLP